MRGLLERLCFLCSTFIAYVYISDGFKIKNTKYIAVTDSEMWYPIMTTIVSSKLACGIVCEANNECVSFSYNNATGICKLNDKDQLMAPLEVVASSGSTLYVMYVKDCETGWDVHKYSCYLFSLIERGWESSKSYCESLGAILVKVDNDDEHQFVRARLQVYNGGPEYFWIGARYNETAGEHRWTDGTAMSYNGWAVGRPGTTKGCVDYVDNTGWLWNAYWDCTNTYGPCVCEKGR